MFQVPDLPAERRLGSVQSAFGRDREAALLPDGYEIAEMTQLHRPPCLSGIAASLQNLFHGRNGRLGIAHQNDPSRGMSSCEPGEDNGGASLFRSSMLFRNSGARRRIRSGSWLEYRRFGSPVDADKASADRLRSGRSRRWSSAGRRRIANFYSDFEARLKEVGFVAGDQFSVADITTLVTVDRLRDARFRHAHSGRERRPQAPVRCRLWSSERCRVTRPDSRQAAASIDEKRRCIDVSELLDAVIAAHGGLERWNSVRLIDVTFNYSGALLDLKGFPGHHRPTASVDAKQPRVVIQRLGGDRGNGMSL